MGAFFGCYGTPALASQLGPMKWESPDGLCRFSQIPIHSHCDRFSIVFSGLIANHLQIRCGLRFASWRGLTDTETLVEGLSQRGPALMLEIRGRFAFAAYDHLKRQLLLARDHLGIHPLYHIWQEGGLCFSSDYRKLFAIPVLSAQEISQWLAWGRRFDAVQLVPPGMPGLHSLPAGLVVRVNHLRPHRPVRYWPPQPRPDWGPLPLSTARRVRQFLLDQLERSVAEQLYCAGSQAGCLSYPSIDSASLLVLASRLSRFPLASFRLLFTGQHHHQDELVHRIEEHCGVHQVSFFLEAEQACSWVEEALIAIEAPSLQALHTHLVGRAAQAAGLDVVLTTLGADALFGNTVSHRMVPRFCRLAWLPQTVRRWLFSARHPNLLGLPIPDEWHLSLALHRIHSDSLLVGSGSEPLQWPKEPPHCITQRFGRISWAELFGASEQGIRGGDAFCKEGTLCTRHPFLDPLLVESLIRIPRRFHQSDLGLLKDACLAQLPPGLLLHRHSPQIPLPLASWILGPLQLLCRSRLECLIASDWLDPDWIRTQWKHFEADPRHLNRVWSLVVLGEYARRSMSS